MLSTKRWIALGGITAVMAASVGSLVSGTAHAEGQNGTTLTAYKTMTAHQEGGFDWGIDKSVAPDRWDLVDDETGTSTFSIDVTRTEAPITAWVDGSVCVTNGGGVATVGLAIMDRLTVPPSTAVIASTTVDVSANPVLDPGESHCYPYRMDVPAGSVVAGKTYKDTATITITNHSGRLGMPFGPRPSATAVMPAASMTGAASVTVEDTNGMSWVFDGPGSVSYPMTYACEDGQYVNTATIVETGAFDDATVTVTCTKSGS